MSINIRAIYNISLKDIHGLHTDMKLKFEDGKIIPVKYEEVILFRYLTDFLPKWEISLTSDIWISNYYVNGYFSSSSYIKLYSNIYKRIIKEVLEPKGMMIYSTILKDMYVAINKIVIELLPGIQNYNIGIEIDDVLPIAFDKELLESIIEVQKHPDQQHIENTYQVLDRIIKTKFKGNILELVYESGMVSINQLRQLFGSRGFLTEINSKIFRTPMVNSFTMGFKNIYEAIIESRAGAKALHLSTTAIRKSEQTAREYQLATMPVEEIVYTDCGNRDYMEFYVRPDEIEDGKKVSGDLPNLIGSRFMNDKGEWETITPDHKHLIGKTIKLRSVLHCKLKNKKQICSGCYGDLTYGLFKHSNMGHINTTNTTAPITQSLLSTKHLLKSATSSDIVLDNINSRYFIIKDQDKLHMQPNILGKKNTRVYIHVPQNQALGFRGIEDINLLNVNLAKMSRVYNFDLEFRKKQGSEIVPIKIKLGNRAGNFSLMFLNYVKKNGYEIDEDDNYVIDITDMERKIPIIKYEKSEFDFKALGNEFTRTISSRKYISVNGRKQSEFTSEVLVQKIFDLVNKKLSINIKQIEVLVYGFTVYDLDKNNFDLGRNSKHQDIVGLKYAMDYRSIGGSFAWSRLLYKIHNPYLFVDENKPDHPLDVLYRPNEVVKYYKNEYPRFQ